MIQPKAPPLLGKEDAKSAIPCPAVTAASTASVSIPCTASENPFIAVPNDTIPSANVPISFSPMIAPSKPPLFGSKAAISASILPALAAVDTASISIPDTSSEKALRPSPRGASSSANSENDDPPVIHDVIASNKLAAVSADITPINA